VGGGLYPPFGHNRTSCVPKKWLTWPPNHTTIQSRHLATVMGIWESCNIIKAPQHSVFKALQGHEKLSGKVDLVI